MKFNRCPWSKDTTIEITARRVAAARRRLAKAREEVALLPDLVAAVPTLDEDLAALKASAPSNAAEWREHWARGWRRARRGIEGLPEGSRRGLMRYWQTAWSGPKSPEYLLTFVREAAAGRSFWTTLRELRQYVLIGRKEFPADRISEVFSRACNIAFRPYRAPEFFLRRRAAKIARRNGNPSPTGRSAQLMLSPVES